VVAAITTNRCEDANKKAEVSDLKEMKHRRFTLALDRPSNNQALKRRSQK
jgi:hypothetical protein